MIDGIFSDELSRDFSTAIELAQELGLTRFELRQMRTGRVPEIADDELRETLEICQKQMLSISAISPGICKCLPNATTRQETLDLTRRSIDFARAVGATKISLFGFRRPSATDVLHDEGADILSAAVSDICSAGITAALENWQSSFVRSTAEFIELADRIATDELKLDWDPCNQVAAGRPLGLDLPVRLRERIASIQVKDGVMNDGRLEYRPLGTGAVGWGILVERARAIGYAGPWTLESHSPLKVRATKDDLERFNLLWRGGNS